MSENPRPFPVVTEDGGSHTDKGTQRRVSLLGPRVSRANERRLSIFFPFETQDGEDGAEAGPLSVVFDVPAVTGLGDGEPSFDVQGNKPRNASELEQVCHRS